MTHKGGDVEPGEVVGDPGLPLINLLVHVLGPEEAPQDEAPEEDDGDNGRDNLRFKGRGKKRRGGWGTGKKVC